MRIARTNKYLTEAYTLAETIIVLIVSLAFFIFPVLSFHSLEKEQSIHRFLIS
ncbi:hypothetical protein SNF32_08175 [Enterococcus mundtii]|nr:hypothetical protein [Enterococcus mundtii]